MEKAREICQINDRKAEMDGIEGEILIKLVKVIHNEEGGRPTERLKERFNNGVVGVFQGAGGSWREGGRRMWIEVVDLRIRNGMSDSVDWFCDAIEVVVSPIHTPLSNLKIQ